MGICGKCPEKLKAINQSSSGKKSEQPCCKDVQAGRLLWVYRFYSE